MITEEQIWNYLDGTLSESERTVLETAIATNKQDADFFREISGLHNSLKSDLLMSPSASFPDKVMASLNLAPTQTSFNISPKLILFFSLPTLIVIALFAAVLVYNHIPVSYSFPVHFAMPVFGNMKLYFILADILLLAFFIDAFSEYRFNRKALFS